MKTSVPLVLVASLVASPLYAQTTASQPRRDARLLAAVRTPAPATPLTSAARAIAASRSLEASQPSTSSGRMPCASRIPLTSLIGAAVGFGSGYGLLAASGGSDSAGAILKAFTLLGAGLGAIGGLIACTA